MYQEKEEKLVYDLGSIEEIPIGEGREFIVGGEEVAIFRSRNNKVYAVQSRCPHRNGFLADGIIGSGILVCPFHSFKFELESGKPVGNDCGHLKTYRVRLNEAGNILLTTEEKRMEMNI